MSKSSRERRLVEKVDDAVLIPRRLYNSVMCGTLLYGFVVNFVLCLLVGDVYEYVNPIAFIVGYFVFAIIGSCMSIFSKNPIISFIGYNFVIVPVGLVISTCIKAAGGIGSEVVTLAFLITACVTACMTLFAIIKPEWCEKFGLILLPCLIGLVIAEVICLILGFSNIIFAWIGAILFSLYIAYDVYRSQQFAPTLDNAIDCALDIYLDIANLFLDILRIVSKLRR